MKPAAASVTRSWQHKMEADVTITKQNLREDVQEVLISETRLQERIRELATQIEADYEDVERPLLLCVLKGAFVFLSDLTRLLEMPHEVDFMAISSYGAGTASSGAVRIVLDLKEDIAGRHILIVEDIIDSGLSSQKITCRATACWCLVVACDPFATLGQVSPAATVCALSCGNWDANRGGTKRRSGSSSRQD